MLCLPVPDGPSRPPGPGWQQARWRLGNWSSSAQVQPRALAVPKVNVAAHSLTYGTSASCRRQVCHHAQPPVISMTMRIAATSRDLRTAHQDVVSRAVAHATTAAAADRRSNNVRPIHAHDATEAHLVAPPAAADVKGSRRHRVAPWALRGRCATEGSTNAAHIEPIVPASAAGACPSPTRSLPWLG